MMKGLSVAVLGLLTATGCMHAKPSAAPVAAKPQPEMHGAIPPAPGDAKFPVIVQIVSRDQIVTIKSGPHGLLYCVSEDDGEILIADATAEEMKIADPVLFHHLQNTMAVEADASSAARN